MFQKQLLLCILFAIVTNVQAQFEIKYNNTEIDYTNANVKYAFINSAELNDSILQSIVVNKWQNLTDNKIKLSYASYSTWLKIPISSLSKYGYFDYININNPHINFLKCWIVKNDSIIKNFAITGDNISYNSRQVPVTTFMFPIKSTDDDNCYVIIAADKRFTKLDLPIIFCTTNYYINKATRNFLLIGIIMGACFFLFLYNTYLYVTVKQNLYIWYSIYLLLIITYIGADTGFLFKYIIPNFPIYNDIIRPSILAFIEFPLLLFFSKLLDVPKLFPRIYLTNKLFFVCYFILFSIAMLTLNSNNYQTHGFWLKILYIIGPIILLFILIQSVYLVIKKVKFAYYTLVSYTSFFIFICIFTLQQREIIATNTLTKYSNYWSIFIEAALAVFLLAWRYKLYKEEAEELLKKNTHQQEQIFIETAAWQEKEMLRMSSLLHDTVGANLGFLRLETDNMPLTIDGRNNIANHITRIGNEVRNMSHSFSPIILKNKGLYNALNDIVKTIRSNSDINLQLEWIGEHDKISLQYQIIIYQILQELLQNLIKHSKANNAFLQILIEQNIISIYVEDDGQGFDVEQENNGIGLKNISNLVSLLRGNYRIESSPMDGFSISIEFNQHTNEKK